MPPPVPSAAHAAQLQEAMASIGEAIARTRTELATLRDGQETARLVDELSAVVDGTADATHTILSAAEAADALAAILRAGASPETSQSVAVSLQGEIQTIFEACNFQDLAGQRIAKVLRTLAFIEGRVGLIHRIWDGDGAGADPDRPPERSGEAALLNGPALPGAAAVSQTDVDSFFS